MATVELLAHVDALLLALRGGLDLEPRIDAVLRSLDATSESPSTSISVGRANTDADGTWVEGIGKTVGTWAPESAKERAVPTDLRGLCEGLLDATITPEEAIEALQIWRDTRVPPVRYAVGKVLGSGGMGDVLAARDLALDRELALKVLRQSTVSSRARFVDEAKLTATLEHPGIIPVHDVGETAEGLPFFAMRRVRGRSLGEALAQGELPSLRARLDVFRRVCETVAFAHDRHVLHLDLKPDNIMLGAFGEVLVMDWGLAREVSDEGAVMRRVAGTPRYMAPEQATKGARLDKRADVYALGTVLYELVCDAPAFPGSDITTVLDEVRAGAFMSPRSRKRGVPRELEALILKAMATDREKRLATVLELLDDVSAYLENRELASVSYSVPERLWKWGRRNRAQVAGAAAVGALAMVALAVTTTGYVIGVIQAREEAVAQSVIATRRFAHGQLSVAASETREGHYRAAQKDYQQAQEAFRSIGDDTVQADLGLAELSWRQPPAPQLTLPEAPDSTFLLGDTLYWNGPSGAHATPLQTGVTRPLDADEVWLWGDRVLTLTRSESTASILEDAAVLATLSVPSSSTLKVIEGRAYDLTAQVAYDLGTGEILPLSWPDCEASPMGLVFQCGRERFAMDTGERLNQGVVSEASSRLHAFLYTFLLRPQVTDHRGEVLWSTDEGRVTKSTDLGEQLAYVVQDGRAMVRNWKNGVLRLRFDLGGDACTHTITAYLPDARLIVGCEDTLRIYSGTPPIRSNLTAQTHGLALRGGDVLYATKAGIEVLTDHGSEVLPCGEEVRDIAVAADGAIAAVARSGMLCVWSAGGDKHEFALKGSGLGVAWKGQTVAAVDKSGTLTIVEDGAVVSVDTFPELHENVWGIAPLGAGWALTDYGNNTRRMVQVVDGVIVGEAIAPGAHHAFDIVPSPDGSSVAVAAYDGAWIWDGKSPARHLPGAAAIGVAWGAAGPVVGGSDGSLWFWSPEGELLHKWVIGSTPVTLAVNEDKVVVATDDAVYVLPLRPGAP